MATEGSRCSSHAPNSGLTFGPRWMACAGAGENVVWRADVGAVAPDVGAVAAGGAAAGSMGSGARVMAPYSSIVGT